MQVFKIYLNVTLMGVEPYVMILNFQLQVHEHYRNKSLMVLSYSQVTWDQVISLTFCFSALWYWCSCSCFTMNHYPTIATRGPSDCSNTADIKVGDPEICMKFIWHTNSFLKPSVWLLFLTWRHDVQLALISKEKVSPQMLQYMWLPTVNIHDVVLY